MYAKEHVSSLRFVHGWLRRNHYKHRLQTENIMMKHTIALKHNVCLKQFFANRELPREQRLRKVCLDESHIYQHCKKNADSIWNIQLSKDANQDKR